MNNMLEWTTQLTSQLPGVMAASPLSPPTHIVGTLDSSIPSKRYGDAGGVELGMMSPGEMSVRIIDNIKETSMLAAGLLLTAMQGLLHRSSVLALAGIPATELKAQSSTVIEVMQVYGIQGQALLDSLRAMVVLMGGISLSKSASDSLPLVLGCEQFCHLLVGDASNLKEGWSSVFLLGFETLLPTLAVTFSSEVEEVLRLSSGRKGKACNKRKAAGELAGDTHKLSHSSDIKPGATSMIALFLTSWELLLEGVHMLRVRGWNVQDCVDALEAPLQASVK
jgi:hypothetical protein